MMQPVSLIVRCIFPCGTNEHHKLMPLPCACGAQQAHVSRRIHKYTTFG
jgi:hypothetical protein